MECVDIFEGMESKYREFGLEDVYGVMSVGSGYSDWTLFEKVGLDI